MRRPEQTLHIAAAKFMRHALPTEIIWLHIPNGGKRTRAEASLFKAMGQLPGAPDFLLIMPNGQASWIELKSPTGVLSPVQIEFQRRARAIGCAYAVCRSFDEVEATLARWLAAYGLTLRARTVAAPILENAQ